MSPDTRKAFELATDVFQEQEEHIAQLRSTTNLQWIGLGLLGLTNVLIIIFK